MTSSLPSINPPLLVGRDRELGVLRHHLDAVRGGQGSLVLIGGEAGIGKTALAEVVCANAVVQGAFILVGRSFDLTESAAYAPWLYLFERSQPDSGLPPPPATFSGPGQIAEVASQAVLFRQVLDYFRTLTTQRPAVLLLDDAQWFDPASLDLLRFLGQSLATLPLLVLLTYRAEDVHSDHPLSPLLPLLVREANAQRLDLRPLTEEAVSTLVADRYHLPDADATRLVGHLRDRGEGNALFIGELLRSLEENDVLRHAGDRWTLGPLTDTQVPPLLRQVIGGRVSHLDGESQRLLAVAAIIGQEVPYTVWAAVVGAEEERLLDVVVEAEAAHLMVEHPDGGGASFVHALVREALYEGVRPSQRRRWHGKTAEVLATRPHADPDGVASHFVRAGDMRAVAWLLKAAERAQRLYAWLTAADRLDTVLSVMDAHGSTAAERGWLHYRLAVLRRFGDAVGSLRHLDEALTLAAVAGDAVLAAHAHFYQALLRGGTFDVRRMLDEMADAVAALESLPPSETTWHTGWDRLDARTAQSTLTLRLARAGRFAEAVALGERAVADEPTEMHHPERVLDAFYGLAIAYAQRGEVEAAAAAFAQARAAGAATHHYPQLVGMCHDTLRLVTLPYHADRLAERRDMAAEGEAAARQARTGGMGGPYPAGWTRVDLLVVEGGWEEVRTLGLAVFQDVGYAQKVAASAVLGPVAYAQDDEELLARLIREGLPAGPQTVPGSIYYNLVPLRLAVARALDAGEMAAAKEWLETHDRWLAWSGAVLGRSEGEALWAQYWRARGNGDEAERHAQRALAHAMEPCQPLALLAAYRLLGELATETGQNDAASVHLDAALSLADACHALYERALTLLAVADLGAATGMHAEAIAHLDEARTICEPLGAKLALARADTLRARLDASTALPPAYPASLSPREVEVLRLLAEGKTNRDIADALFLSEHTVRVHVRNILTKTNTDNRTAAAAFARQHSLV